MPVPDYENDLVFPPRHDKTAYELQLENNKLRGLLKECRNMFDSISLVTNYAEVTIDDLLTRINATIGESEK